MHEGHMDKAKGDVFDGGRRGRDNGGKQEKDHKGTCIKDTWTKPKGVGLRMGGTDEWQGDGGMKMEMTVLEQLYI